MRITSFKEEGLSVAGMLERSMGVCIGARNRQAK